MAGVVESLLLAVTRIETMQGDTGLTNATGFFFSRGERLFVVTARHVLLDEASGHEPDGLMIDLHVDPDNVAGTTRLAVPLYRDGKALWRQAVDSAGMVDVAALELDRAQLPDTLYHHAFGLPHVVDQFDRIEVGTPVLIVGFPLGFHDTLHVLPVARQAVVASAFGIRFQGHGYFLTDAQTHRGSSGAPVVARAPRRDRKLGDLPWLLLGVHAARMDVSNREPDQDAWLNLNCAWYADILETLTDEPPAPAPESAPGNAGPDTARA